MKKTHILIVEDEECLRRSLMLVLRKAGYRVSFAVNGSDALGLLSRVSTNGDAVDFLVFDIAMPEMTGVEMYGELRKARINIPCLAMTGYSDKAVIRALNKAGCKNCIEKPFQGDELLEQISLVMNNFSDLVVGK